MVGGDFFTMSALPTGCSLTRLEAGAPRSSEVTKTMAGGCPTAALGELKGWVLLLCVTGLQCGPEHTPFVRRSPRVPLHFLTERSGEAHCLLSEECGIYPGVTQT